MAKQDTSKEAPGGNGKSKYRIWGRFLRKKEEVLDKAWKESRPGLGSQIGARPGLGSQIGTGKVKHKARRVGVRDRDRAAQSAVVWKAAGLLIHISRGCCTL